MTTIQQPGIGTNKDLLLKVISDNASVAYPKYTPYLHEGNYFIDNGEYFILSGVPVEHTDTLTTTDSEEAQFTVATTIKQNSNTILVLGDGSATPIEVEYRRLPRLLQTESHVVERDVSTNLLYCNIIFATDDASITIDGDVLNTTTGDIAEVTYSNGKIFISSGASVGDTITLHYFVHKTYAIYNDTIYVFTGENATFDIYFVYTTDDTNDYREIPLVDIYPLESSIEEGFFYISNEEKIPESCVISTSPTVFNLSGTDTTFIPYFYYGTQSTVAYLTTHSMITILDGNNNPVSNKEIRIEYSTDNISFLDCSLETDIIVSSVTNILGNCTLIFESSFLKRVLASNNSNIKSWLYINVIVDNEIIKTHRYRPTELFKKTNLYAHLVLDNIYVDSANKQHYTLCAWGEYNNSRLDNTSVEFFTSHDGLVQSLGSSSVTDSFPFIAVLSDVILETNDIVYCVLTKSSYTTMSRLIKVE